MTVSNNYAPVVTAANGVTTVFTGTWNALAAAYLVVQLLNTTTGVYTTVTQGVGASQYLVTSLTSSGWVITFNTAPASGNNVVVSRNTAQTQIIPYTTSRGFQGSVEEGSFDALTNMVQELSDMVSNSLQVSVGDTAASLVLPIASLRANFVLAFDASGNVVVSTLTLAQIQSGSTSASASATAAAASAASALGSQTAAAASAAAAANIATGIIDTSTTSNTVGTGALSFTVSANKLFQAGQFITISDQANSANYVHGTVTSYSGTTLVINSTDTGGSGTKAAWNVSLSGTRGTTGSTGPQGAGLNGPEATVASATTTDLGAASAPVINISGTTTITGLGNSASVNAPIYFVRFSGALTLTNSGTLILPTGANITTSAGDTAVFKFEGSSTWRCMSYQPVSGKAIALSLFTALGVGAIIMGYSNAATHPAVPGTPQAASNITPAYITNSGPAVAASGDTLSGTWNPMTSNGSTVNGVTLWQRVT